MLEKIYDDLVDVSIYLYETFGKFSGVAPEDRPSYLAKIQKAYSVLREVLNILESSNQLEIRKYSYDDLCWMPLDFVDLVNSSNLIERFCLLGEAVSCWNALHSHLGSKAPICPLLDPTSSDPNAGPNDF